VLPLIELAHVRNNRPVPRHATATVTELARIGLFPELPGEVLNKLAHNMRRADVGAGDPIVLEGEEGDHFYVILRGLCAVSNQGGLGPRRMLRPGDYFGEVALTMHVPRTASVTALVPTTLASCDKETFDEYVRPLFADDDAPSGGSAEDV
jgi:ATP-binding cassette, subfamily B, bacterial